LFSIEALLGVLGGVTDSVTIIQGVRRRLRNLSANKIYIDLLDEQFRNERTHAKLDVNLDKNKLKQAMRQSAVDLKRTPLLADELDNAIGDSNEGNGGHRFKRSGRISRQSNCPESTPAIL
jgi:hypothetical protein